MQIFKSDIHVMKMMLCNAKIVWDLMFFVAFLLYMALVYYISNVSQISAVLGK